MCGIAGYIGESKKPEVSFKIINEIFKNLETRGKDASGFWGTDLKNVFYFKNDMKSSDFVNTDEWKNTKSENLKLLVLHSRQTSVGVGNSSFIKNNHPFVNHDKSIALTHNGRIYEYHYLKNKYYLESECDSEVLLRIFENNDNKLDAIRDIWSLIYHGHMAVAIGESSGNLWLFRNKYRTLCFIDLLEELGQIFYVSSPEIWFNSVDDFIAKKTNLIEIPPNTLIKLSYKESKIEKNKFNINCSYNYKVLDKNYIEPLKIHPLKTLIDKIKIDIEHINSTFQFCRNEEIDKLNIKLNEIYFKINNILKK